MGGEQGVGIASDPNRFVNRQEVSELKIRISTDGNVASLDAIVNDGRAIYSTRVGVSMTAAQDRVWIAQAIENVLSPLMDRCNALRSGEGEMHGDPDLISSCRDYDLLGDVIQCAILGAGERVKRQGSVRAVAGP